MRMRGLHSGWSVSVLRFGLRFGLRFSSHILSPPLMRQTHVEMESITLGGVTMGFGIETNSHSVGLFQESVLEYELVDSCGKRHKVRKRESECVLEYELVDSCGKRHKVRKSVVCVLEYELVDSCGKDTRCCDAVSVFVLL